MSIKGEIMLDFIFIMLYYIYYRCIKNLTLFTNISYIALSPYIPPTELHSFLRLSWGMETIRKTYAKTVLQKRTSFIEVQPLNAHHWTHTVCSLHWYLWRSRVNNVFFVSFCNNALPDIQSQAGVAWLQICQLTGKMDTPPNYVLTTYVAKRKTKAGIGEWAEYTWLSDANAVKNFIMKTVPYKTAYTNVLPGDEHMMFETCERHQGLN